MWTTLIVAKFCCAESRTAAWSCSGLFASTPGYLSEEVRSEIEAEETPLGRVLIEHNVLRRVELGKLWEVIPDEELQRHFNMDSTAVTFGRTAIIHCDGEPAIELVEIVAPEAVE